MSERTTSSTVFINGWTYIFLNRPNTNTIDFFKFRKAQEAASGKGEVGTAEGPLKARPGPISAIVFNDGSIRLYYTGPGKDDSSTAVIREVKLPGAGEVSTNAAKAWLKPEQAPELKFEEDIAWDTRTVDATSFLSASTRIDAKEPQAAVACVTYRLASEKQPRYCYQSATDGWGAFRLAL